MHNHPIKPLFTCLGVLFLAWGILGAMDPTRHAGDGFMVSGTLLLLAGTFSKWKQ